MIRTRFSPSPTGMIHLGNARAALFSALYAVHEKGGFLLRIEDTDQSRSEQKFTDILQDDLRWLGIDWQEGPDKGGPHAPYWQSKRHETYAEYYQKLEESGQVYPCFCSDQELALNRKLQLSRGHAPRYPGTCRRLSKEEVAKRIAEGEKPTLRFRVPVNTMIEFEDLVKGLQRFNSDDIGDFIIRRADGTSSFLFCNAIDDSLMEITHVIRGEDHLANTPRQLMILQTLKMRAPQYAHLSLILGEDGAKLSKRHGSSSLHDLRVDSYLPLAVLNYLSRLSHPYEENRLLSFAELAHYFHLDKVSRAPARFDKNQLLHWQKEAVMKLDNDALWKWLDGHLDETTPADKRDLFIDIMRKNILFPDEAIRWNDILFGKGYEIRAEPEDSEAVIEENQQKLKVLADAGVGFFVAAGNAVNKHKADLKQILEELKAELNISGKRLFMPIRIALTGEEHGPELVHIATLLGSEEMARRFEHARDQAQLAAG